MAVQLTALELSNTHHAGNPLPHSHQRSHPYMHSRTRVMMIAFFYYEGILCCEYISQSKIIKQYVYLQMLRCLCNVVHHKQPQKWESG
jgi:hypothetical protein